MSLLANLFQSSIGRKFLMAVSGLILTGFVAGHLVGNLQIFGPPDAINGYAHFLQSLGPTLWALRLGLLAAVAIHVWAAVALTLENRAARGPDKYGVHKWLQAAWASRYMRLTGVVVAVFIVYHILHFTVGLAGSDYYKGNIDPWVMTSTYSILGFPVVPAGAIVEDVYSMIFVGFSHPLVAGFYILAVGLLSVHLLHGIESMFQTLGWRNQRWACGLRAAATLAIAAYFLGNLAIPASIFLGLIQPDAATYAAWGAADCSFCVGELLAAPAN